MKRFFLIIVAFAMQSLFASAATQIKDLRVQRIAEPIAVEDARPTFGWRMESDRTGAAQKAYQIVVSRAADKAVVWNSGRVESATSQGVCYSGVALRPETEYEWALTVWDDKGAEYNSQSCFETALMDPRITAWKGADWIGSKQNPLDAASLAYFEISADVEITEGDSFSMVLGGGDFRLMDYFQNPDNIEGENYIRVDFNTSEPSVKIYRYGYTHNKADNQKPFVEISKSAVPESNVADLLRGKRHHVALKMENSNLSISIDGTALNAGEREMRTRGGVRKQRVESFYIGLWGSGHNYNTIPNLGEVGFVALPQSSVTYRNYEINLLGQTENSIVFDNSNYHLFNELSGVSIEGEDIVVKNASNEAVVAYTDPSHGALSRVRSEFAAEKKIAKARLYATAMGALELFINGERVGEDWFTPGDSQFREVLGYHAYDVTEMLQQGKNCIAAQLSPGWYTGSMTFTTSNYNFFGDNEALLARLVITYDDGSKQEIVTNPATWQVNNDGPIRYGSFFGGERYDARKESEGWNKVGYATEGWRKADRIEKRDWIDFAIEARYDEPVRVREVLSAERLMPVASSDKHTYIYDMGVNMVGVPEITIPEGWLREGDEVIIRFAEQLYPGDKGDDPYYVKTYGRRGKNIVGRPLYETYRAAYATDFYIAADSEQAVIKPTTTFRGYQYIQITIPSHEGPLPLENVRGVVLSSDQPTGEYVATSADGNRTAQLVNQLFTNIQRSQLGNFFTIPTDCPQRNERMGWTGDAQAYARTATYNSDARNFFRQWMKTLRADQGEGSDKDAPGGIGSTCPDYKKAPDSTFADGTTWAAAICMVPWQLYTQYGDRQIVEENMEAMMMWLNGMDFYDMSPEYTYLSGKTTGLADWLSMDPSTPSDLVNNAIYIYMMEVTAIMAEATGYDDYAAILRERHARAKEEWNRAYVDPVTHKTRTAGVAMTGAGMFGGSTAAEQKLVHSQSSYATPLNFNCFNEENRPYAEQYLAELAANPSSSNDGSREFAPYTITTGFSGTPNILPALSRAGQSDVAYRMFTCTDFTSWLYPVTKGATSVWERWNGFEVAFGENNQNSMNSFNHFALGSVGQWMYEFQLGITTDHAKGEAGYQHFVLQPSCGANYTSLAGSYNSDYGVIRSKWQADGKGRMTAYDATVPANTSASLYLPIAEGAKSFGEGEGVRFVGTTKRHNTLVAEYELTSGEHSFEITTEGVVVK